MNNFITDIQSKIFTYKTLRLMLGIIIWLFFLMIVFLLVQSLVLNIFPPAPEPPTDLSFMLLKYMGLPFIFWILLGFGLMFGISFHGFKIIHIENVRR